MTVLSRVGLAMMQPKPNLAQAYESPRRVEELVREALLAGGLGRSRSDAPLADIIQPGMTVLLKPNWVLHRNQSGRGMDCMVTHPTFVLAALKEVVAAGAAKVVIADAPVQGADFDALTPTAWRKQVVAAAGPVSVEIRDLRNLISHGDENGLNLEVKRRNGGSAIEFDLGRDSLLDAISKPAGRFRVTCYDPKQMAAVQRPGSHRYQLSRSPFVADVVINLPKLKAHKKAGLTGALKNLVGINVDKSFLPHHRRGGSAFGGDCYPGGSPLKLFAEFCLDRANERIGQRAYNRWKRLADALGLPGVVVQHLLGLPMDLEGSWHGNDTVWRMVLDLNRLLRYGCPDGTIASQPQRNWYSLTDGIVAGQGEGPLAPSPLALGAVTFAANPAVADVVHATLLRFCWQRIPLVRCAFKPMSLPLVTSRPEETWVSLKDRALDLAEVASRLGMDAMPPKGWAGHIELKRSQKFLQPNERSRAA